MSDGTVDTFMVDFDGMWEPEILAAGSEVQVRILDAEIRESKQTPGSRYLNLRLEVPDNPKAKEIFQAVFLPGPADDAKKANNKKRQLYDFGKAFGVDLSKQTSISDLRGETAWAILDVENDPQYGSRNVIKRWVLGS